MGSLILIFKQLTPKKKEEISSQSNNSTRVFIEVFFKFIGNKAIRNRNRGGQKPFTFTQKNTIYKLDSQVIFVETQLKYSNILSIKNTLVKKEPPF